MPGRKSKAIKPLGTIEQELAACRKAFRKANPKDGDWVWCCHHEVIAEVLSEPWESRVAYIMSDKPEHERASRLRAFRPVVGILPTKLRKALVAYNKARDAYGNVWDACNKARDACNKARDASLPALNKQIKKEWPDTTWNSKKVEGT